MADQPLAGFPAAAAPGFPGGFPNPQIPQVYPQPFQPQLQPQIAPQHAAPIHPTAYPQPGQALPLAQQPPLAIPMQPPPQMPFQPVPAPVHVPMAYAPMPAPAPMFATPMDYPFTPFAPGMPFVAPGYNLSQAITAAELANLLPVGPDGVLDRDLSRLLRKAQKYCGVGPGPNSSSYVNRSKYEKYAFLTGALLVQKNMTAPAPAGNDQFAKLANMYLANPMRYGSSPEAMLAHALGKDREHRRSSRHRHHHHHHRHHSRSRSRHSSRNGSQHGGSHHGGSHHGGSHHGGSHRAASHGGLSDTSYSCSG